MFAFVCRLTYFSHLQAQFRLNGIEERRLADAALTGEDSLPALQESPQPLEAKSRACAGEQGRNAQLAIEADIGLNFGGVDQVSLVQAKDWGDLPLNRAR